MACRCGIVKLARVVQAMAASLRLLQALKSLFLDHRRLFHNVEERLAAEEGAARTTTELKATAGTHSFSTADKPMKSMFTGAAWLSWLRTPWSPLDCLKV